MTLLLADSGTEQLQYRKVKSIILGGKQLL